MFSHKINKTCIAITLTTLIMYGCGGGTTSASTSQDSIPSSYILEKANSQVELSTQVRTPSSSNVANPNIKKTTLQLKSGNVTPNNCFVIQKQDNGKDYNLEYKSDTWYSTASVKFTIKNQCDTAQSMSGVVASINGFKINQQYVSNVSNIGQDGGSWVDIPYEINSDIINLNFTSPACDGSYCDWTKLAANSTKIIQVNTSISTLINSIGITSITINSDTPPPPPPATTGNLNVIIDSTSLHDVCKTQTCNLKINVIDPSTRLSLPPIKINPAESALYSMNYQNVLPGKYTLSVDSNSLPTTGSIKFTYAPSDGTVDVHSDATSDAGVKFSYTAPQEVSNLTVALASIPDTENFTTIGDINATALDTTESTIYSFKLNLGKNTIITNLPVGHQYKIHVQGIANASAGSYYSSQDLLSPPILKSGSNIVNMNFVPTITSNLHNVVFNITGLPQPQSVIFADDNGSYKYTVDSLIDGHQYKFLTNDTVAMTLTQPVGYSIVATPLVISSQVNNVNIVYTKQQSSSKVFGWPEYLAMGAIGGPNIDPQNNIYSGGDDSFGGKPIDAVFKYAGNNGNGDPGVIDPPMNALRMTTDLTLVSNANQKPSRVVIVEYIGEMSGGENFADFTNTSIPNADKQGATYIMARHFASLSADAIALADKPVIYNGQKYYGSLIMNPDLLGAMQQNNYTPAVNNVLSAGAVNTAVDQALCLMTNERTYTNNDEQSKSWSGKSSYGQTYTGTPYSILNQMLADNFPTWLANAQNDQYWGISINNAGYDATKPVYSQVGQWFNSCAASPTYDKIKYNRPNFPAGFEGWVQANNWLIRTFAPKDTVTFGWQTNMWSVGSGYWMHQDLTNDQIATKYSTPVINWLKTNAPSTISNVGTTNAPDYFVFDRYEMDDSAAPGQATLYSARSWDNFLIAVGQVSKGFNNIPLMLWQIPGSHIPYIGESTPELFNNIPASYIFSSAPVYFFGDSNLKSDLSNMIMGAGGTTNTQVGNFKQTILSPTDATDGYHCPIGLCTNYQQYLMYCNGKANNYDWSKDNGKLTLAQQNNVFAILWGGGNTTNVIKNFSNPDDHGWLASKIKTYYANPQPLN